MLPLPGGVPAVLEAAREPLETSLHRADTFATHVRLTASTMTFQVDPLLSHPSRLISLLHPPAQVALPVAIKQRPAGKSAVPRLLAKAGQVPGEVAGPGGNDVDGVVGHRASPPLLGHPNRARVLLSQLGHRLRRYQVVR